MNEFNIVIKDKKFFQYVKFIDNYMGLPLDDILTLPFRDYLRDQMIVSGQFDSYQVKSLFKAGYWIMPFWKDEAWYAILRPINSSKNTKSNYVIGIDSKVIFQKISFGKFNKLFKEEKRIWENAYKFTKEHIWTIN